MDQDTGTAYDALIKALDLVGLLAAWDVPMGRTLELDVEVAEVLLTGLDGDQHGPEDVHDAETIEAYTVETAYQVARDLTVMACQAVEADGGQAVWLAGAGHWTMRAELVTTGADNDERARAIWHAEHAVSVY